MKFIIITHFVSFLLCGCVSEIRYNKDIAQSYKSGFATCEREVSVKFSEKQVELEKCQEDSRNLQEKIKDLESKVVFSDFIVDNKDEIQRVIKKLNKKRCNVTGAKNR